MGDVDRLSFNEPIMISFLKQFCAYVYFTCETYPTIIEYDSEKYYFNPSTGEKEVSFYENLSDNY